MLELRIQHGRRRVPIYDLSALLGHHLAYGKLSDPGSIRASLEAAIENMIALLDVIDGDCDLEEDDPAGGNVDDERQLDDARLMPAYRIDQNQGPSNYARALQAYHREQEAR